MFKKVLIAEDMEDINKGVYALLTELSVSEIQQVQYCDDAYLKIKRSALDNEPFELLITDLSFKADYRSQTYPSGEALVEKIKSEFPELKVIVYGTYSKIMT